MVEVRGGHMGTVYFIIGVAIVGGGIWLISQMGKGGSRKGTASFSTRFEDRVCTFCGKGNRMFDAVKIYTRKYGWYSGYAHGSCLEEQNRQRR